MSDKHGYVVEFSALAETDLIAIAEYVADQRDIETARRLIAKMRDRAAALSQFPLRGAQPRELEGANRAGYRQLSEGPYRIIYRIADRRVIIMMIVDGRRDMQTLLRERLLRSDLRAAD